MACRDLKYESLPCMSLNLYLLQKNFAILSSPHKERSKILECMFTRVSLEAENVTSFKQNSENSPHLKTDGSATLSERLFLQ